MNKMQRIQSWKQSGLNLILTGALLSLCFVGLARADDKVAITGINIEYKMDPRISRGLYMGDRWIAPPTYITTLNDVEIRASGIDAQGASVSIQPQWISSDPEMVTVTPSQGKEVKITVKRAGDSRLRVAAGAVTKEVAIKAISKDGALQVEITQPETAPPVDSGIEPAFKSEREKLSYALGMSLGIQFRQQALEPDLDVYMQGLKDAISGGKTRLSDTEARILMAGMQDTLKGKADEQGEKSRIRGEAFLAGNRSREGVVTLESGLQYRILKEGSGTKPTVNDTVVCHYRGTLIDGTEFDSSYKRNQPATLDLNKVIRGWQEALQLMPVGSKWQIFIPPDLGYGTRQAGKIAPNSTLVFEVELMSIKDDAKGSEQAAK